MSKNNSKLVPTIEARDAQATVESDRVRIFAEITSSIGLERFNSELQRNLESTLHGVATEMMMQRGVVESAGGGGTSLKESLGMVRTELQEAKQLLAQAQEETKEELKQEMEEVKHEMREVKQELAVLAVAQEQQVRALEAKIDMLVGHLLPPAAAV